MPFDVAVEEPDAWRVRCQLGCGLWREWTEIEVCGKVGGRGELIRIIGSEAQDNVSQWAYHEGIPSHRHGWECLVGYVFARLFFGANDGLEVVAVQMEGMSTGVEVVEYDLYNVVVF